MRDTGRKEIYISVWEQRSAQTIGTASYMTNGKTLPAIWELALEGFERQLTLMLQTYSPAKREAVKYISNKLSDWFLDVHSYDRSAYLGHNFLYNTDLSRYGYSADAILYPSVAQAQEGVNFAFSVKGSEKLQVKEIIHMVYESSTEKGVTGKPLRIGHFKEGSESIIWESHRTSK
ncbi:MAG: hypothetical protein JWP69_2176 [Flaviaesturariibacter sp.]|nr:hypothetical protein [Flaviaesturariibacter sp.]